jgi:predicted phosphodiesterase
VKIQVGSDLHLEFVRNYERGVFAKNPLFPFTKTDADFLLLAGDIDQGIHAEDAIKRWLEQYKFVFMIPGNHEYYRHDFDNVKTQWRSIEKEMRTQNRFVFLQDEAFRVADGDQFVSFIGSTLWTSFNNADPRIMQTASAFMNDYRLINLYAQNRKLRPADVLEEHLHSKRILAKHIKAANERGDKVVVMTHHAMSKSSTHPRYAKDVDINHLYSDSYPDLLEQIDIHVHGHTHESFDYVEHGCRVICNPYGYHGYEVNRNFKSDLVVETNGDKLSV